jgi:hypothetical protein
MVSALHPTFSCIKTHWIWESISGKVNNIFCNQIFWITAAEETSIRWLTPWRWWAESQVVRMNLATSLTLALAQNHPSLTKSMTCAYGPETSDSEGSDAHKVNSSPHSAAELQLSW